MGKTHIMKLAYAACQASRHDVSFSQKTTMLFRPDQSSIGRLVNRNKNGNNTAKILVESDTAKIGMLFSTKTKKWDAEIKTEEKWEKQMSDLSCHRISTSYKLFSSFLQNLSTHMRGCC